MSCLATVLSQGSSNPQDQACAVLPLPHWPLLQKPLVPAALAPTLPFPKHCTGPAGLHPGLSYPGQALLWVLPGDMASIHLLITLVKNVKLVLHVTQSFKEGNTVPMT